MFPTMEDFFAGYQHLTNEFDRINGELLDARRECQKLKQERDEARRWAKALKASTELLWQYHLFTEEHRKWGQSDGL